MNKLITIKCFLLCALIVIYSYNAVAQFDAIACVATSETEQRARVMARPGMTAETFEFILSKQMPSAQKCELSDFVIDTTTPESATADVEKVIKTIKERMADA